MTRGGVDDGSLRGISGANKKKEEKKERDGIYLQLSYYFKVPIIKTGPSRGPEGTQPHPQDKESSLAAYQYTQILRPYGIGGP